MTTRPAAANLHYGDGNAEEVKDVRTDQKRGDEQQETVHGHLSRQGAARRPWVVPCKRQEYRAAAERIDDRSEEHTSELQSRVDLVCRLLLEKKKKKRKEKTRPKEIKKEKKAQNEISKIKQH